MPTASFGHPPGFRRTPDSRSPSGSRPCSASPAPKAPPKPVQRPVRRKAGRKVPLPPDNPGRFPRVVLLQRESPPAAASETYFFRCHSGNDKYLRSSFYCRQLHFLAFFLKAPLGDLKQLRKMTRPENLLRRADLLHKGSIHTQDPVRDPCGKLQLMQRQDHCQSLFFLKLLAARKEIPAYILYPDKRSAHPTAGFPAAGRSPGQAGYAVFVRR